MTKIKLVFCLLFILILSAGFQISYNNRPTAARLGKQLFTDKILSKDYSVSCASCHKPAFGFADTVAFSVGVGGKLTPRNTPSVLNMKNRPYFYWDGRAPTLQAQALMPIAHPNEMNLPIDSAVKRLQASAYYNQQFVKVFGKRPSKQLLGEALAAFERTLETSGSKMDLAIDDKVQLTVSEERGRKLFVGEKAKCFDCHFSPDFTGDEFRNIGLYNGVELNDVGRYAITKNKKDIGAFKVPGLRNVGLTAPYMHNGMFATLEEVVAFYNNPKQFVPNAINTDDLLKEPLGLTAQEQTDLVAFLRTLTDKK